MKVLSLSEEAFIFAKAADIFCYIVRLAEAKKQEQNMGMHKQMVVAQNERVLGTRKRVGIEFQFI